VNAAGRPKHVPANTRVHPTVLDLSEQVRIRFTFDVDNDLVVVADYLEFVRADQNGVAHFKIS